MLEPKQEQVSLLEREVTVAPAREAQPELNLGALGSLLVKEMVRPEDEEGERLTVKNGVEALGVLDAIDTYLSKSDKS